MLFQVSRVSFAAVLVLLGAACGSGDDGGGDLDAGIDAGIDAPVAGCGNGVLDPGETCDGAALGDGTCDAIGFDGGELACNASCAYEVAGCCNDTCLAEDQTMCIGNTLRSCTVAPSGCLEWVVTDCAATNDVCDDSDGTAACSCVDRCPAVDDVRCEGAAIETCGMRPDGCLDWMETTNCAAGGEVCAMAPSGAICVPDESAEDCAEAYPLSTGDNVIAWAATDADHLTAQPSCNTTSFTGPDLVLSYTAPENGFLRYAMAKPTSARQVIVVSSAACGTMEPELSCVSEFTAAVAGDELGVTAGTTYYFYIRDTTSGTAPLDNPMIFNLEETLCSGLAVTAGNLSPASGTTVPNLAPVLSATLDYPADPTAGVITVTGNLGTSLSYDLATVPDNIAFADGGTTLIIDPGRAFPPNEMLTVSWTGLTDATCGRPIPAPTWTFQVSGPPCTPGMDGMVGSTITRVATGIPSFTEQYVAVDTNPAGYVYVGGLSNLYRTEKTTGSTIDVVLQAPLAATNLGYDMLIRGDDVFTLDSSTTSTSPLFRISTTGGTAWSVESYLTLPQTPNDDLRGVTEYEGRIYLTTDETTAGTQIWSVAADAVVLPAPATLEATLATEDNCSGIALDDTYYYLACGGLDRTIRVDRTTHVTELLTSGVPLNTTKNTLHAHDFDGDGSADALYIQDFSEEVHYLCEPTGDAPYTVNILASFGTGTSNYGLGFDPVTPALWMFDDDTREFVEIR